MWRRKKPRLAIKNGDRLIGAWQVGAGAAGAGAFDGAFFSVQQLSATAAAVPVPGVAQPGDAGGHGPVEAKIQMLGYTRNEARIILQADPATKFRLESLAAVPLVETLVVELQVALAFTGGLVQTAVGRHG